MSSAPKKRKPPAGTLRKSRRLQDKPRVAYALKAGLLRKRKTQNDGGNVAKKRRMKTEKKGTKRKPLELSESESDEEESSSSTSLDEDQFVVESILKHRFLAKPYKKLQFLIKWKGYSHKDNTWIDDEDLDDGTKKTQYIKKNLPDSYGVGDKSKDPDFKLKKKKSDAKKPEKAKDRPKRNTKKYPPVQTRVLQAITTLYSLEQYKVDGVTRQAVYNDITKKYPGTMIQNASKALAQCVEKGELQQKGERYFPGGVNLEKSEEMSEDETEEIVEPATSKFKDIMQKKWERFSKDMTDAHERQFTRKYKELILENQKLKKELKVQKKNHEKALSAQEKTLKEQFAEEKRKVRDQIIKGLQINVDGVKQEKR